MATGSGLTAQLGLKKETTYGTRAVPDLFYEFEAEGGQRNQKSLVSRQLGAGRTFQSGSRRVATTRDAAMSISGEVPNKGFGSILDLGHGNTVTPAQQGSTTAYLQTHPWTGDPNKSASIQAGKTSSNGTVNPFDYLGCMMTQLQLSCAVDDWLKFVAAFDAQDEKTDQSLAVRSLPSALTGFSFQQATVTVNGVVQDLTTGSLVKSMGLDLALPRDTGRFGLRSTALKAKPIQNDVTPGTGSIAYEFTDMVQYGLFTSQAKVPIIFDFLSDQLAGTGFFYRFTATIAQAVFTGETPKVDGPAILNYSAPFEILDDGTNPPVKFEVMEVRSTAL